MAISESSNPVIDISSGFGAHPEQPGAHVQSSHYNSYGGGFDFYLLNY
jgi:hypothetical protein